MIRLFIPCEVKQKGSKIAINNRVIDDNPKATKLFEATIRQTVSEFIYNHKLKVDLNELYFVHVHFNFVRPKSHFTKKGLRPDAPKFVGKKPDLDKSLRSVFDALTGVVYADDKQIVGQSSAKTFDICSGLTLTIFSGERIGVVVDEVELVMTQNTVLSLVAS